MSQLNVLIIGSDLTSNGGIASVIKAYHKAYIEGNYSFEISMLKTSYYRDKSRAFAVVILIKSIVRFFYLLMSKNIGILHIHSSANISFFRKSIFVILGRLFNKKVIIHIHASRFYDFFLSKNRFVTTYISFIFKLSDLVVVLCSDWESKLKTKYPNANVRKIVNPIVLPQSKNETIQQNDVFSLLFVGFLIESKGIKDLLHLALLIKRANIKDVKIIIAGKGALENYIMEYIKKEDLHDFIDYVGWANGEIKEDLYRRSNIFVLPSYNEGMPISILEAMSYGKPVLSTNIAGIPDIISDRENGFLFTPGDVNVLYERVMYLKGNTELMNSMRENNLLKVKDFSNNKVFEQIVEMYGQLG